VPFGRPAFSIASCRHVPNELRRTIRPHRFVTSTWSGPGRQSSRRMCRVISFRTRSSAGTTRRYRYECEQTGQADQSIRVHRTSSYPTTAGRGADHAYSSMWCRTDRERSCPPSAPPSSEPVSGPGCQRRRHVRCGRRPPLTERPAAQPESALTLTRITLFKSFRGALHPVHRYARA
jgi:hypothetical protein